MKRCPTCSTLSRGERRYCQYDGTVLAPVATGDTSATPPATAFVTAPIGAVGPDEMVTQSMTRAGEGELGDVGVRTVPGSVLPTDPVRQPRNTGQAATHTARPLGRTGRVRSRLLGTIPALAAAAIAGVFAAGGLLLGTLHAGAEDVAPAAEDRPVVAAPVASQPAEAPEPPRAAEPGPLASITAATDGVIDPQFPDLRAPRREITRPAAPRAPEAKKAVERTAVAKDRARSGNAKAREDDERRASNAKCPSDSRSKSKGGKRGIEKRVVYYGEDEE